jgi:hypothetical protein
VAKSWMRCLLQCGREMSILVTIMWKWTKTVLIGLLATGPARSFAQAPSTFTCAQDAQVDTATRQAVDSVALAFTQTVLGADASSAFDLLTEEGKANSSRQQMGGPATEVMRHLEPKKLALQHTYLINLKGSSPGRVICGQSLAMPDGWESLAAKSVPEQAHVLLTGEARNNQLATTVWLLPEQGKWRVQSFWVGASSYGRLDTVELLNMARAQRQAGHRFNAAMLYTAATETSYRGANFQMGIAQAISDDLAHFDLPSGLKGQAPFLWSDSAMTYKVLQIGPISIANKLYIVIAHEVAPWQSNEQVEAWNKQVLAYFKGQYPEYAETFSGVVVRAQERGTHRGYGTVEETIPLNASH